MAPRFPDAALWAEAQSLLLDEVLARGTMVVAGVGVGLPAGAAGAVFDVLFRDSRGKMPRELTQAQLRAAFLRKVANWCKARAVRERRCARLIGTAEEEGPEVGQVADGDAVQGTDEDDAARQRERERLQRIARAKQLNLVRDHAHDDDDDDDKEDETHTHTRTDAPRPHRLKREVDDIGNSDVDDRDIPDSTKAKMRRLATDKSPYDALVRQWKRLYARELDRAGGSGTRGATVGAGADEDDDENEKPELIKIEDD
ncbi:hypothetical protein PYCC9005_005174 [Savitreella phatthalungensis]